MVTRWARFARGWLAAAFSTFVAAFSHTVAGSIPSGLAIVLSLAFSGMVCVVLAGKTLSRWRLGAAVVASQFMFHGFFSLIGNPVVSAVGHVGHHPDPGQLAAQLGGAVAAAGGHAHLHDDTGMWVAHALAALVTYAALRHGESTYWRLLELTRLCIVVLLARMPEPVGRPPIPAMIPGCDRVVLPHPVAVHLSVMRHRGPPPLALGV